jgi:hypothetical protein
LAQERYIVSQSSSTLRSPVFKKCLAILFNVPLGSAYRVGKGVGVPPHKLHRQLAAGRKHLYLYEAWTSHKSSGHFGGTWEQTGRSPSSRKGYQKLAKVPSVPTFPMKHDLVDAFWLKIFPVTLGAGKRLFADGTIPAAFKVTESTVTSKGVIIVNYEPAGAVPTGSL